MYVQRSIMVLVIGVLLFFPGVQDWLGGQNSEWYRPFLIWLAIILFALLLQQVKDTDEF